MVDDGHFTFVILMSSFSPCLGEVSIAADTVRQLASHSISGDHCVTFGYHFTEPYRATDNYSFWSVPDWSKNNADHSDDLIFVFGGIYCKENYKAIIKGGPCFAKLMDNFAHVYSWK